ncbi:hypothetical protein EDB19DRAFT_1999173 [Suillus lakei]|nr:hypothetical protein EDB19DRAFT_1999173 [Suillus lakei]
MSLAAASQLPTIPGAILRMSSISLAVDFTYCGLAVSLTICQSDRNGNAGKLMARHSQCNFFKFFSELLQYPDILATIPSSSKSPTILSAPPEYAAIILCRPANAAAPLHAAGTLAFPRPLKWEAVFYCAGKESLLPCKASGHLRLPRRIVPSSHPLTLFIGLWLRYMNTPGGGALPFTRRFSCL